MLILIGIVISIIYFARKRFRQPLTKYLGRSYNTIFRHVKWEQRHQDEEKEDQINYHDNSHDNDNYHDNHHDNHHANYHDNHRDNYHDNLHVHSKKKERRVTSNNINDEVKKKKSPNKNQQVLLIEKSEIKFQQNLGAGAKNKKCGEIVIYLKKKKKGGYGEAVKAVWRGDEVAVKQLKVSKMSSETIRELQREAKLLQTFRHPRIVILFGMIVEEGYYALVIELMRGGSLSQFLQKFGQKPNTWNVKYRIALDIAYGLDFLHHNRVLHRGIYTYFKYIYI